MKSLVAQPRASFLIDRLGSALRRIEKRAMRSWALGHPFSGSARERLLLVTVDDRVAQSQIDPFHHYANALRRRYGAEIREVPVERFLRGERPAARDATTVCFQTSFAISTADLFALIASLKTENPEADLVYLDWFSPTDLRLASVLDAHVSLYVKKHLFRNRDAYGEPTYGETNIMDYYGRRFGLEHETRLFPIPERFFDKLIIGPSFVTADAILHAARMPAPPAGERPIDVHARLGVQGTEWYRRMRSECVEALRGIGDLRVAAGAGLHPLAYLRELRASKVCFSPFGYGEVCWRDYEAIVSGSVLLKPDVSHLEADPDIFVAGETYVPVRWDLADLEDTVRWLIGRPARCRAIAENAFAVLHDYVESERFVDHIAPILGEAHPGRVPAGFAGIGSRSADDRTSECSRPRSHHEACSEPRVDPPAPLAPT